MSKNPTLCEFNIEVEQLDFRAGVHGDTLTMQRLNLNQKQAVCLARLLYNGEGTKLHVEIKVDDGV